MIPREGYTLLSEIAKCSQWSCFHLPLSPWYAKAKGINCPYLFGSSWPILIPPQTWKKKFVERRADTNGGPAKKGGEIMKIESTEDYQKAIARIDQLVAAGPERDSEDGIELQELADTVAAYESMRWPM